VTSVSGDVLQSSSRNIARKRKAFEGPFTEERQGERLPKRRFLSLPARRPVPFVRIREAMWL
jgi:hypothetical protein